MIDFSGDLSQLFSVLFCLMHALKKKKNLACLEISLAGQCLRVHFLGN